MSEHSREPVGHTCPDIDKVLKELDAVKRLCKLRGNEDEGDLKSIIEDIEHELWDTDYQVEKIREDNILLREWGTTEAAEVDDLNEEMSKIEV